jgi:hypothetical protein
MQVENGIPVRNDAPLSAFWAPLKRILRRMRIRVMPGECSCNPFTAHSFEYNRIAAAGLLQRSFLAFLILAFLRTCKGSIREYKKRARSRTWWIRTVLVRALAEKGGILPRYLSLFPVLRVRRYHGVHGDDQNDFPVPVPIMEYTVRHHPAGETGQRDAAERIGREQS